MGRKETNAPAQMMGMAAPHCRKAMHFFTPKYSGQHFFTQMQTLA
jgi:hypothetical protein